MNQYIVAAYQGEACCQLLHLQEPPACILGVLSFLVVQESANPVTRRPMVPNRSRSASLRLLVAFWLLSWCYFHHIQYCTGHWQCLIKTHTGAGFAYKSPGSQPLRRLRFASRTYSQILLMPVASNSLSFISAEAANWQTTCAACASVVSCWSAMVGVIAAAGSHSDAMYCQILVQIGPEVSGAFMANGQAVEAQH